MKFGAMNFPVIPVVQEIETFGQMGFDYLELTMDPPFAHHSLVLKHKKEILKKLKDHNLDLICHLPTFVSTADLTPGIRAAALKEMLDSLDVGAEIGAQKVVLHPSMVWGMGAFAQEDVRQYADEFLTEMVAAAEPLNIIICLENMMPRNLLGVEPDYFDSVFLKHPTLQLTLDTGHAVIDAPDGSRLWEFVRCFAGRIGHIHVSDNGGRRDDHLAPGEGIIDFPKLLTLVKDAGYDSTMTLEVFDRNRDKLLQSKQKMQKLLSEKR